MTIDKAIEVLTDQANKGFHFPDSERKEASRLGAESLKLIKRQRDGYEPSVIALMPGETE